MNVVFATLVGLVVILLNDDHVVFLGLQPTFIFTIDSSTDHKFPEFIFKAVAKR